MYAVLWRLLPGPRLVKALQALVLAAGVVAVCFLWVFPAVAPLMPFNETTVTETSTTPASPTTPTSSPT